MTAIIQYAITLPSTGDLCWLQGKLLVTPKLPVYKIK